MNLVIREKDKQILFLVSFIIIIVIDLLIILRWQCRSLIKNYNIANERKQAIMTLKDDIINLEIYKKEIIDLEEKLKNLELLITDEDDISVLIEIISNLANESGVKILQIKPITDRGDLGSIQTKDGIIRELEIQIVAKSDFHLLGNFINKIELAKNVIRVSSLLVETDTKNYFIQNIGLSLRSFVKYKDTKLR